MGSTYPTTIMCVPHTESLTIKIFPWLVNPIRPLAKKKVDLHYLLLGPGNHRLSFSGSQTYHVMKFLTCLNLGVLGLVALGLTGRQEILQTRVMAKGSIHHFFYSSLYRGIHSHKFDMQRCLILPTGFQGIHNIVSLLTNTNSQTTKKELFFQILVTCSLHIKIVHQPSCNP